MIVPITTRTYFARHLHPASLSIHYTEHFWAVVSLVGSTVSGGLSLLGRLEERNKQSFITVENRLKSLVAFVLLFMVVALAVPARPLSLCRCGAAERRTV